MIWAYMRSVPPSRLDMIVLQDWEQQPELVSYLEESLRERQKKLCWSDRKKTVFNEKDRVFEIIIYL